MKCHLFLVYKCNQAWCDLKEKVVFVTCCVAFIRFWIPTWTCEQWSISSGRAAATWRSTTGRNPREVPPPSDVAVETPFVTLHIQSTRSPALPGSVWRRHHLPRTGRSAHAWLSECKREGGWVTNGKKVFFEVWVFLPPVWFLLCFFLGMNSWRMPHWMRQSFFRFVFLPPLSPPHLTFQWCVCCQWRHRIQSKRNWFKTIANLCRNA